MANFSSRDNCYKVYIAGPCNVQVMALFRDMGFYGTNELMDAHLCVFTGGSDIDTELYGEEAIPECGWFNEKRDEHEVKVFHSCVDFGIPMVGICRGGQLLNVLNGGKLWQDVTGHGSGSHEAICSLTGKEYTVTSSHHQMMIPAEGSHILMVASVNGEAQSLSTHKKAHKRSVTPDELDRDPEVVWYEETQSLCVQFHPEYESATAECREYFNDLVTDLIFPDTEVYDVILEKKEV